MKKTDNKKRQASQHPLDRVVNCRDWPEDKAEDGEIFITLCINCGHEFTGFQSRFFCKDCVTKADLRRKKGYGVF
jgi:hypothetical protein